MKAAPQQWRGVIEEYRERLPVDDATPVVTLREGGTPLIPAEHLSRLTRCDVHLKVEGDNPTGSFKDRGMTVAISRATVAASAESRASCVMTTSAASPSRPSCRTVWMDTSRSANTAAICARTPGLSSTPRLM